MIAHPGDPSLRLIEVADLDAPSPPPEVLAHGDALRAVVDWAETYLCRPHPDLGRNGPVCPYAQGSLSRGRFYLAVPEAGHRAAETVEDVVAAVEPYRAWFTALAPLDGPEAVFTTILLLLPGLGDRLALVDGAQDALKNAFVEEGLMIGEFHDGPPDKPGLWNPLLRPLAGPVPLLAIRHMVATDLPFLWGDPAHRRAYLTRFDGRVPAHLREIVMETIMEGAE
ncbi:MULTISPECIES: DUF6875 domain-containing protein [unclassified Streptosporangium]|uniref:DUF6875 domain-containing protein n=1 Tax=unclassified Streptosporangium TaxID=2632669 RepID=UPI002E2BE78D|nr:MULTISPECIES: hypothetical protein [unclassified Streptosporangium]